MAVHSFESHGVVNLLAGFAWPEDAAGQQKGPRGGLLLHRALAGMVLPAPPDEQAPEIRPGVCTPGEAWDDDSAARHVEQG